LAPTLLLDGDRNRSALRWAEPGKLPFKAVDNRQAAMHIGKYKHVIVDTEAHPEQRDMKVLAGSCDLLILTCTPDSMAIQALEDARLDLGRMGAENYRVLLTIIPPLPNRDGEEARQYLTAQGMPVFQGGIRRIVAFQRAALAGVTVDKIDRDNLGWEDYARIGEEIERTSAAW
jgi:chromosome partitioning protein